MSPLSKPVQPTTQEIADAMIAQFSIEYQQTTSFLPKSFLRIVAYAIAAMFQVVWQYVGWIFLGLFVKTAPFKETVINGTPVNPLVFWGELIGVGVPLDATQSEGDATITVNVQSGSLNAGSQLINSTTGVIYSVQSSVALDAPTKTIVVKAVGDQSGGDGSGLIGDLTAGDELEFVSPFANVARTATVTIVNVNGEDAETESDYRTRVIERFKRRPQGGAAGDYIIWSEVVPGIVDVFPYVGAPGEVDVYVESTNPPDGIPTAGELLAVQAAIEQELNGISFGRPVTAIVNVLPITRTGFDVDITGLTGVADLPQTQSDILDALTTYFADRAPFVPGGTIPPKKDIIAQTAVAGIIEDVVTAAGGVFTTAAVKEAATPFQLRTLGTGELSKLDSVTYL